VPVWLSDLLQSSPWIAIPGAIMFGLYKVWSRACDSPTSVATFIGLLAGKERRKDGLEYLKALREVEEDGDPPPSLPIERHSSRRRGPRRRKRKRSRTESSLVAWTGEPAEPEQQVLEGGGVDPALSGPRPGRRRAGSEPARRLPGRSSRSSDHR
jgi:hypothetical protein